MLLGCTKVHSTDGPGFYIGDNEDPRHIGERAELKGKIAIPDG